MNVKCSHYRAVWGTSPVVAIAGMIIVLVAGASPLSAAERTADAAIKAGLAWLAEHQIKEGPDAGAWQTSRPQYKPAMAAFAGLAFLANGYQPSQGEYGQVIDRAMEFVIGSMDAEGYLGQGDPSGMYIHAICTLFGLSYLGASPDPEREVELAKWCRRSLKVIIDAQAIPRPATAQGGWRYTPYTTESDLSVTSWQMLVLHAARQCGYRIDRSVTDAALAYINRAYTEVEPKDSATNDDEPRSRSRDTSVHETRRRGDRPDDTSGRDSPNFHESGKGAAGFVYRVGVSTEPEPSATGVAIFIKSLFEKEADEKVRESLAFLRKFPPSWGGEQYGGYYYFALFYISQGMFQVGGGTWERYRLAVAEILIEHQNGDGSWPFPPDNRPQSRLTGDSYSTALAILVLSLEKQYLPMYQRQKSLF